MPLAPGTRLGPYEVVSPIGKGGMGEVYRARDTKLEREVAIKVLPEQSANDEERLARFEREAKLLASLNHPNIASIYGFEEGAGVTALVLELVEGPTLAQRIARGPIPVEEAIAIAKQIAEALEAGHEAGVIHRDLKPANIKVKEDGTVKVLDYGLAKALEGDAVDGADSELSQSPTLTRQGTQIGVILGTTPYMSPEQAKGKRVDKRSDIFSFGVVLYEMLTGEKAFAGDDVPEILASIINREPEWSKLPSDLDPRLPGLVRRCLRKDPKKRVRDIGDVRNELEDIEAEPSHRSAQSPHPRPSGRDWLTWTSFAVAAGLAVTLAIVLFGGVGSVPAPPASGSRQQFAVHPPDGVRFTVGETPALSPDGRYLAFVATDTAGQTLLWIRSLDSLEPRAVPRTEGATFPFWSPDSQFIGFFADGQLKKIEVAGGPPQIVAPAADSRGGAWSSTGEVLFSPRLDTSLYRVPAQGGRVEPATSLDPSRQEASHRLPSFLPDGRRFLFVIQSGDPDNSGLYMGSLDSGEVDRIGNIESKAIFTSSGHLLYTRERTLMAQRFDPERKALVGDPAMLVENVAAGTSIYGERAFSASSDGKLAHWNEGSPWSQPAWFDRHGEELESAGPPGLYDSMSLSPDGTKAAYERWDPHESSMTLWVHDFARGVSSPFSLSYDWGPTWSPDGKTIAYGSLRHGSSDIYGKGYSMGQEERLLFGSDDFVGPMDWSADGRYLVFINYSRFDIGLLPVDPPGDPRLLLDSEFVEKDARLSPDGRWMAFTSNESGAWEVWIQSFPDLQNKLQVSNAGGSHPEWDPDGNELYYISRDRRLMSVAIEGGSKVQLGSPRALFPSRIVGHEFKRLFAVARNGERFLMIVARETENSAPITLTLNWTAGLKP